MSSSRWWVRGGVLVFALSLGVWAAWAELTGGAAASAATDGAGAAWRHDPLWDDGNAEFCAYEVAWPRYGSVHPGTALLVLVKEPWAPDLEVKADAPRPDGFDVLKLNHIRDVRTGIYAYRQMASVYQRRDSGELRKLTATSSEACGISTAEVVNGRLDARSYFDGQGNRRLPYPPGALPEDGLPASLRDWVSAEPPPRLSVFPSLMMGRYGDLEPRDYAVRRRDAGEVETALGRLPAVEIALERDGERLAYLFEAAAPHRLLRYERTGGAEYRLAKCERIPYWRMNQPGGEEWYPEGFLGEG